MNDEPDILQRLNRLETRMACLEGARKLNAGAVNGRLDRIIESVALVYGVTPSAIRGQHRSEAYTLPRFMVYGLARELTRYSTVMIGAELGNRDHSTILCGIARCEEIKSVNPDFCGVYDQVGAALKKEFGIP